ncbi:hypothetical protein RN001_006387 [Aquatica leii]|uniref:EF-hand domain-containing protein n=1 Tax=Aquatica leii TaxID=1421715 RepID=A0AAN7QKY5_9COLE|nr:hypothetical protein RN001_006387 [Aquatica leii]
MSIKLLVKHFISFGMISKFLSGVLDEENPIEDICKQQLLENGLHNKFDFTVEKSNTSSIITRPKSLTQACLKSEKWLQPIERKTGKINAKELQEAFLTFQGKHFSDASCKFVVRLFDLDKNGGLDVPEFEQLYSYVKEWVTAFNAVDRGRTGFLDETQFDHALKEMDICFSPDFIKFLISKSDLNCQKISLDQFIVTCVQLQKFTDEFKDRDPKKTGNVTLKLDTKRSSSNWRGLYYCSPFWKTVSDNVVDEEVTMPSTSQVQQSTITENVADSIARAVLQESTTTLSVAYMSGFIAKRILENLVCTTCCLQLLANSQLPLNLLINYKEWSDDNRLTYPAEPLVVAVSQSIVVLEETMKNYSNAAQISVVASKAILDSVNFSWITCSDHGEL